MIAVTEQKLLQGRTVLAAEGVLDEQGGSAIHQPVQPTVELLQAAGIQFVLLFRVVKAVAVEELLFYPII